VLVAAASREGRVGGSARIVGCWVGLALLWATPALAHADAHVTALDGRSWADVVSDWVEDTSSQGTAVSLCVREQADRCLPCGAYAISIDPAVAVGGCDPASGATSVLLVDRSALFDHSHAVPVPRAIAVRATLAGGTTTESVAPRSAGTGVGCSVRVRPYVRDLEHGSVVMLGPDAYDVVVAGMEATVEPSADGSFVVSSSDRITTTIAYDVVERATGAVVLVGHATLDCTAVADVPATAPGTVAPLPIASRRMGARTTPITMGGGIRTYPRDAHADVADGLVIAGAAIGAASAIALLGIGLGTLIHTAPDCVTFGAPTPRGGPATGPGPSGVACTSFGPPHPSETPAELSWSMVGGLGLGLALGLASIVARDAMHEGDLQLAIDLGPNGGGVMLGARF
jgi:hypothetical protein